MLWNYILSLASFALISSVVHAAPDFVEQKDGLYYYTETITGGTEANLPDKVEEFFNAMYSETQQFPGYKEPAMGSGLLINSKIYAATSGTRKVGPPKVQPPYPANFPQVLKTALDECFTELGKEGHRKNGNCAELRAIAYYFEKNPTATTIPEGTPFSVFGYSIKNNKHEFHNPCNEEGNQAGCRSVVIEKFKMKNVKPRKNKSRDSVEAPENVEMAGRLHSRDMSSVFEN